VGGTADYLLWYARRADIDEAAWSMLYRTESRPFQPPETGKIAVKVINHYGDEVMKVTGRARHGPSGPFGKSGQAQPDAARSASSIVSTLVFLE
jgi:hypothetical protein